MDTYALRRMEKEGKGREGNNHPEDAATHARSLVPLTAGKGYRAAQPWELMMHMQELRTANTRLSGSGMFTVSRLIITYAAILAGRSPQSMTSAPADGIEAIVMRDTAVVASMPQQTGYTAVFAQAGYGLPAAAQTTAAYIQPSHATLANSSYQCTPTGTQTIQALAAAYSGVPASISTAYTQVPGQMDFDPTRMNPINNPAIGGKAASTALLASYLQIKPAYSASTMPGPSQYAASQPRQSLYSAPK